MSTPEVTSNAERFQAIAKEAAKLEDAVSYFKQWQDTNSSLRDTQAMLRECEGGQEAEMAEMAREEITELQQKIEVRIF